MSRIFEPEDDRLIYHYCSSEGLRAILESKRLRFTDINMLNDPREGRWGYEIFEKAVTRLVKRTDVPDAVPVMPIEFFDAVDRHISSAYGGALPFASCFSLDGDSLDQWRAYADNGQGFAIGFRAAVLKAHMPVMMLCVEYEEEVQIKEMMAALVATFEGNKEEVNPAPKRFFEDCFFTATLMTAFKHSSYRNEREVRCSHSVTVKVEQDSCRFVDVGGENSNGQRVDGVSVNFRITDNHLSAYVDLPFEAEHAHPVAEIVAGPKNFSNPMNVLLFTGGLGYKGIKFKRSEVQYR